MQLVHRVLQSSVCPQPLAVLLPSRALELALPLGKAGCHKCLCLPCPLAVLQAVASPTGSSSCSSTGRTAAAVVPCGLLIISC